MKGKGGKRKHKKSRERKNGHIRRGKGMDEKQGRIKKKTQGKKSTTHGHGEQKGRTQISR